MRSVEVRLRSSLRCPSNISRWRFLPLEFLVRKGHLPDSAELTPNAIEDCRHPLHSRLCGSLLRHGSNRPQLNCLALGRPQIPAQLSAPVRPGGSLTEAKCWAVRFPCGGGRPAPISANKTYREFRKIALAARSAAGNLLYPKAAEQ